MATMLLDEFLCEMKSEGLTFVKMQHGRRFSTEEALRLILNNTAEDSFINISSLL